MAANQVNIQPTDRVAGSPMVDYLPFSDDIKMNLEYLGYFSDNGGTAQGDVYDIEVDAYAINYYRLKIKLGSYHYTIYFEFVYFGDDERLYIVFDAAGYQVTDRLLLGKIADFLEKHRYIGDLLNDRFEGTERKYLNDIKNEMNKQGRGSTEEIFIR